MNAPADLCTKTPYPGLRPFDTEDQHIFFGREDQIAAMLRQLEDHRFVAVVGSSGCGKSSLVRAGLLPAIREGFLSGIEDWLILVMRPGHEPFERLADELSPALGVNDESSRAALLKALRRGDRGIVEVLEKSPKHVLIVVDQFEELFAFRRISAKPADVASRDDAGAFVNALIAASSEPKGRVWVMLTMRSDFIGESEAFLGLPEAISESQFLVPRLKRRQMKEAIVRPGEIASAAYGAFSFDEELVNRIINDAGDRPDQLPLMQHALMRTWQIGVGTAKTGEPIVLTQRHYDLAGGIDKALSQHADAAWKTIKEDKSKALIARNLFLLLSDISTDGQITRRRPLLSEVREVTGCSADEIRAVIHTFNEDNRNFLIVSGNGAEARVDISHEALLRQWQLFTNEWLPEERKDVSDLKLLTDLSAPGPRALLSVEQVARIAPWRQKARPEWGKRYVTSEEWTRALEFFDESRRNAQREARNRQILVMLTIAVLCIAATTCFGLWIKADNAAQAATAEQRKAEIAKASAEASARDAGLQKRFADEARVAAVTSERKAVIEKDNADLAKGAALEEKKKALRLAEQLRMTVTRLEKEQLATKSARVETYQHQLMLPESAGNAALQLAREDDWTVGKRVLQNVLSKENVAKRFVLDPEPIMVASVGFSEHRRRVFLEEIPRSEPGQNVSPDVQNARRVLHAYLAADPFERTLAELEVAPDGGDRTKRQRERFSAIVENGAKERPQAMAERLVVALRLITKPEALAAVNSNLRSIVTSLSPAESTELAARLAKEASAATDPSAKTKFVNALRSVGEGIAETKPAPTVQPALLALLSGSNDSAITQAYCNILVNIAQRTPSEAAAIRDALLTWRKGASAGDRNTAILAVARFLPKPSNGEAGITIDILLDAIDATGSTSLLAGFGQQLADASALLGPEDVSPVLERVNTQMTKARDYDQVAALGRGFAVLVERASEARAVAAVDMLIMLINRWNEQVALDSLGTSLSEAGRRHAGEAKIALTRRLEDEIKRTLQSDKRQIFLAGIAATLSADELSARFSKAKDSAELQAYGNAVVNRSQASAITPLASDVITRIRGSHSDDERRGLAAVLATAAAKLPASEPSRAMDVLLEAITATSDLRLLQSLERSLTGVARKLPPEAASPMVDRLIADITSSRNRLQIGVMDEALAVLVDKLETTAARTKIARLLEEARALSGADKIYARNVVLGILAPRASESQATTIKDELVAQLKQTPALAVVAPSAFFERQPLGVPSQRGAENALLNGLTAAVAKLPPEQLGAFYDCILKQLSTSPSSATVGASEQSCELSVAILRPLLLAASEARLHTVPAEHLAETLLSTWRERMSPERSAAVTGALIVVCDKVTPRQAEALFRRLVRATRENAEVQKLAVLRGALRTVAQKIPVERAPEIISDLYREIVASQSAAQVNAFSYAMVPLASRMKLKESTHFELFAVLKYPSAPHDELLESIRVHYPQMPRAENGMWSSINWLHKNLAVDFEQPAK